MSSSHSLGKRPLESRPSSHVSNHTTIIPKRPRQQCHDSHPSTNPSLKALQSAWKSFESDVNTALLELRSPKFEDISNVLTSPPDAGQVPAVCINMGAAAAAGDRAEVFRSVLKHVESAADATILPFESAHHSTMTAVTDHLEAVPEHEAVIVAVEDADAFPEDTLRDLVYLCGKRRDAAMELEGADKASGSGPRVAILFGHGTSANSLHSALGIEEAAVIAPTNVDLPNSTHCFRTIVEKVLARREHPILFCQPVYDLIETEFYARESTISVVMRSLYQMYSLHCYRQPLAAAFSKWTLSKQRGRGIELSGFALKQLREDVPSVRSKLTEGPLDDKKLKGQATEWCSELWAWRRRCYIVEQVVYKLIRVLQAPERGWTKARPNHSDLRLHIFRSFLVKEQAGADLDVRGVARSIVNRIRKSSRQQMLKAIEAMKETMEACEVENDEQLTSTVERLKDLSEEMEMALRRVEEEGPRGHSGSIAKSVSTRRTIAKGGAAAKQRRDELLRSARVEHKESSVMKVPREALVGIFSDLLDLVDKLASHPMHEVLLFSDVAALQELSGGLGSTSEPRTSFFNAMRRPSNCLGSIPENSIPDTVLGYRLLAEGGRMKNLYDWYHSFSTMRTVGAVERDADGNITGLKNVSPAETQVRFSRVCAELEFLGLLKHTNRKTDHVLRLTFE
ncbi:unnamed protein product [Chondrus crispus]|uniref:Uncharacterized protein n=1 Tax=Chondrus crispus TaxID=2769 RepID=R7QBI0_CHOCR|nr:unnamed protein product [Chondrus crispus]CDF35414.1 unnamed protein product [Chondrus crispus]|eukprot:XP_005715233.1 unnamed protein product [Chondrus crispus]